MPCPGQTEVQSHGLNMDIEPSRIEHVRKEAKSELLRWKSECEPSSPQHIAANVELVRRDDQMKSWFWATITIMAVSLIVASVVWFRNWPAPNQRRQI